MVALLRCKTWLLTLLWCLLPAAVLAEPALGHRPPALAPPDEALELDFAVTETMDLTAAAVMWRRLDHADTRPAELAIWRKAPIEQSSTGVWRATIPREFMDDPGIAYYVVAVDRQGQEILQFASPDAPHPVYVRGTTRQAMEMLALRELGGRRSDLRLSGEYVDYRVVGGVSGTAQDFGPRYSDFKLTYRHWILKGVEYIEAGVGRMRGVAPVTTNGADNGIVAGYNRGWAELGVALTQYIGIGARLILGADEETFRVGGAGILRLGLAQRSRMMFEASGIPGVGFTVLTGFHLCTIPRFPLALEVIFSSEPNAGKEVGERGRLRIGYEFSPTVTATALGSYQAMKGAEHGFGGGGELAFKF